MRRAAWLGVAVAVVLATVARLWGQHIYWRNSKVHLRGAPFFGRWDFEFTWWILPAIAVGTIAVFKGPSWARRFQFRHVVLGTVVVSLAFTTLLAASGGVARISTPLDSKFEYYPVAVEIDDIGEFVDTYVEGLEDQPTHVRAHPPGMVVTFWALGATGASGPAWAAALVLLGAASATAAVLLTVRELAGTRAARRAAPFLAITPLAVWIGTTADAWFAAAIAWGIALIALATGAGGRQRTALGFAGGLMLAYALYLTYGAVPLLLVPLVIVIARRAVDVTIAAVIAALLTVAAWTLAGFWWFEGFDTTRSFYERSSAKNRPYHVFVVVNLGAFAIATGLATFAGLASMLAQLRRWRRLALVVAPVLVAVLAANLTGLSKGEIERIWIPYGLWLTAATATLDRTWVRPLLGAQLATAVVLELWLNTPW